MVVGGYGNLVAFEIITVEQQNLHSEEPEEPVLSVVIQAVAFLSSGEWCTVLCVCIENFAKLSCNVLNRPCLSRTTVVKVGPMLNSVPPILFVL